MPLQPCSHCRSNQHDSCEALASPFCGCRVDGHPGAMEPPATLVAPIDEVLAAIERSPRTVLAQEQETVATTPGAVGPTTSDAAPVDPSALLGAPAAPPPPDVVAAVLGELAPLLDVGPLEADDTPEQELPPELVPSRGSAGLGQAAAPVEPIEDSAPETFTMATDRPPGAYVSLWDGTLAAPSTALGAGTPDPEPYVEPEDAWLAGYEEPAVAPEHDHLPTPDEPYACACGANPGSPGKLASHLGVQDDPDANAKLTLAARPALAEWERRNLAPALDLAEALAAAGNELLGDDESLEVEWSIGAATDEERIEVDHLTDEDGTPIEVAITVEPAPEPDMATVAGYVATPKVTLQLPPGLSFAPEAYVCIYPETGSVVDQAGNDLPTEMADALLEHFGWDPTPLDADHPVIPGRPPAPSGAVGTLTRALAPLRATKPTRIQVARLTTECQRCQQPATPGEPIGFFTGVGWCHLTHEGA